MGYTMNYTMKQFLHGVEKFELAEKDVTITFDEQHSYLVKGLRLDNTGYWNSWDKEPVGDHYMIVTVEGLSWKFPVSRFSVESKRQGRTDAFAITIDVTAHQTSFKLLGLLGKARRLPVTLHAAIAEIEKLQAELDTATKERDAARYEKLQVEGMISNLRGDLKRLLGL